jgi:hypothetical protein
MRAGHDERDGEKKRDVSSVPAATRHGMAPSKVRFGASRLGQTKTAATSVVKWSYHPTEKGASPLVCFS